MTSLPLRTPSTGKDAPDPSLVGPIRNIVATAHKWGGDGDQPKFDKIRRVLVEKHPEVIARAFGGDPNKAAAWIKDNWRAMHGLNPWSWRAGKNVGNYRRSGLSLYQPHDIEQGSAELFLADDAERPYEKDGLVWMPVSRTGTWQLSPLGKKPLRLTQQFFEQVIQNFRDKAWEYVTMPLGHDDDPMANTGFVKDLELRPDPNRPGEQKLWAGVKYTEPGVAEKVLNGSIASRSVNITLNPVTRTSDGQVFRGGVLKHIAHTNQPWLDGIGNHDLAASRAAYELDGDDITDEDVRFDALEDLELATGDTAWDNTADVLPVRSMILEDLQNYGYDAEGDVVDYRTGMDTAGQEETAYIGQSGDGMQTLTLLGLTVSEALVGCQGGWTPQGPGKAWVVGYQVQDGDVMLDPPDRWTAVERSWVELSLEGWDSFADDLELGWMPAHVDRSKLPDDHFAAVWTDAQGQKQRKLPYKLNGKPVKAGVSAALKRLHSLQAPARVAAQAKKRLVSAAQQVGIDTSIQASKEELEMATTPPALSDRADLVKQAFELAHQKYPQGVPRSVTQEIFKDPQAWIDANKAKGGAKMSRKEGDVADDDVTLTREQLDKLISERMAERDAERELELAKERKRVRELEVRERVRELEEAGYTPALIKRAEEIYLADDRGDDVVSLSRDGEEVTLSRSQLVDELLAAMPKESLALGGPKLPRHKDGDDQAEKTDEEKADEAWKDLKEGPRVDMVS